MDIDWIEFLKGCIVSEREMARLYKSLRLYFRDDYDFWNELYEAEINHEEILTTAKAFRELVPEVEGSLEKVKLPALEKVDKALRSIREVEGRMKNNSLTLEEALQKVLLLEESIVESYFRDLMTTEASSQIMSYLQNLYDEEKSHVDMVKDYMRKKGFKR